MPAKAKAAPVITPGYTRVNREFIVELSAPVPDSLTNDAILAAANAALVSTNTKLILVGSTEKANVSLLTDLNTAASTLEPYFASLSFVLRPLGLEVSTIRSNTRWAKFILTGVLTNVGNGPKAGLHVTAAIKEPYPQIILCQVPRWLSRPENRQSTAHSSMVFAVPGSWTVKTLGVRHLIICSTMCHHDNYLTIKSNIQCRNCEPFGQHGKWFSLPPVCVICALAHSSSFHKCLDASCNGGLKWTHTPIKCVKCPNALGHHASDTACPALAKLKATLFKSKTTAMDTTSK